MRHNPFERLPTTVTIFGEKVPVNTDFRVGVSIETEMLQSSPDVEGLLQLFYMNDIPEDVEEAAKQMIEFYAKYDENDDIENAAPVSKKRLYDFKQDADALTASFRQAYGIDLETDELHWWKFRRLMFGLPVDSPFMQRVQIRSVDINKVDKSQKKYYRRMKALYAIRQTDHKKRMSLEERDEMMKNRVRRRFEEAQSIRKD